LVDPQRLQLAILSCSSSTRRIFLWWCLCCCRYCQPLPPGPGLFWWWWCCSSPVWRFRRSAPAPQSGFAVPLRLLNLAFEVSEVPHRLLLLQPTWFWGGSRCHTGQSVLKSSTAVSAATAATTATTGPICRFRLIYADLPPEYKRLLTGFSESMTAQT
jgi:hypothetical protein